MKYRVPRAAVVVLMLVLAACSPRSDPAPGGPLPATADGLAGTTWQFEGFIITFLDPPDLVVRGDGPDSLEVRGTFRVEGGAFSGGVIVEVTGLDRTWAGTWDGSSLVIDGMDGVRR
jgi:hypothetical protein